MDLSNSTFFALTEQQHILIVDDDAAILNLVKQKLEMAGFATTTALSGAEALNKIRRNGVPHLAIVDISMPGMDGFEFCERIQRFTDLPIILLSAIDEEDIIVQGIERFAEDYMTKPFSPRELLARVQRVLRRIGDFGYALKPVIHVDDHLEVDFANQHVSIRGNPLSLTPTETKLLYILMRNAGHVVTADFLLHRLWPLEEVYEEALRVHIHRLRRKIETEPGKPRYIVTQRGRGYQFPKAQ
jgi:DNA-binding response OmpR family regulator